MSLLAKPKIRRDGWTPERQLRFLDALARTGKVGTAAAEAGMSRESAHRLRNRPSAALFAALWDRIMQPATSLAEDHSAALEDGRLARLLGMQFRRKRGDFSSIGQAAAEQRPR